ncbi:MAG: hypothetical protein M3T56_00595 [Chloroflexota bacterium]|nr:hypothetical protein [Chloroflexota bacterium]
MADPNVCAVMDCRDPGGWLVSVDLVPRGQVPLAAHVTLQTLSVCERHSDGFEGEEKAPLSMRPVGLRPL